MTRGFTRAHYSACLHTRSAVRCRQGYLAGARTFTLRPPSVPRTVALGVSGSHSVARTSSVPLSLPVTFTRPLTRDVADFSVTVPETTTSVLKRTRSSASLALVGPRLTVYFPPRRPRPVFPARRG